MLYRAYWRCTLKQQPFTRWIERPFAGSKFDLKVEYDGQISADDVHIRVNGKPLRESLTGNYELVAQEDGKTLGEMVRRVEGMKFGIVTDAEIEDATPAAVVAHTRRRADKDKIVGMIYNNQPDVILGGGSAYFLPQTTPGSKRKDDIDYIKKFQDAGYTVVTNNSELTQLPQDTDKLLGLFHTGNMNGVYDRRFADNDVSKNFPDQPDLTTMTQTALDILSKDNDAGFVLVIESALIDKAAHPFAFSPTICAATPSVLCSSSC